MDDFLAFQNVNQLDEILCPHDMDWNGTYILDDELQKIFSSLSKDANLDVLLDSCHSGTGIREAFAIEKLPHDLSFKPRFLQPPADIQARMDDDLEGRRISRIFKPMNQVFFAARRDSDLHRDEYWRLLQQSIHLLFL